MTEKIGRKVNDFGLKALSFVRGDETKSAASKIKASLFAILIGLIIGIIPIAVSGGDAITSYVALFTKPFNEFKFNSTLIYISIFILIGAGIGVSFKTGLFNIGAAGQMLMAGAVTTMIGIKFDFPKEVAIPVLIIIAMIVGAFTASIAGFLKAQFNVHEVVSTILLNWIIFYLVKYIFLMEAFKGASSDASQMINPDMKFDKGNDFEVYMIVIVAVVMVAMLAFVLKFTTFGFKLRMNGLNSNAAEYAGVNKKVMTIASMAISGAFIGVGGFIYYSTLQGQMPSLGDNLPTIAFEAITVTLLAFSSPLGAIIAGAFYGIIYNGAASAGLEGGVPKEVIDLVIGIIVFCSALAPILVKTRFFKTTRDSIVKYRNSTYRKEKAKLSTLLKTERTRFAKLISEASRELASKKDQKSELQAEWQREIHAINLEFKKHKITLAEKQERIAEIEKQHKIKIAEIQLLASKQDYKTQLIESKSSVATKVSQAKLSAKIKIIDIKKANQISKFAFWQKHEAIAEIKENLKKEIAEIEKQSIKFDLNKQLANQRKETKHNISMVNKEYNDHKIDIIDRDAMIKEVNKKYKKLFTKNGFDELSHLKSEKKSVIHSHKKQFKITAEVALASYAKEVEIVKSNKRENIASVRNERDAELLKLKEKFDKDMSKANPVFGVQLSYKTKRAKINNEISELKSKFKQEIKIASKVKKSEIKNIFDEKMKKLIKSKNEINEEFKKDLQAAKSEINKNKEKISNKVKEFKEAYEKSKAEIINNFKQEFSKKASASNESKKEVRERWVGGAIW